MTYDYSLTAGFLKMLQSVFQASPENPKIKACD
jgi:hypothetical protein